MENIFPLAGAVLVLLEVCGSITLKTEGFLPLGGSHITQMAIVFGLAFVVYEITAVLHHQPS
jgi:hypothetical protein